MENQTEQQEQCFLHQGFILKERVLGLDPQRAEKLLQTQYKLCCTSAERAGDHAAGHEFRPTSGTFRQKGRNRRQAFRMI